MPVSGTNCHTWSHLRYLVSSFRKLAFQPFFSRLSVVPVKWLVPLSNTFVFVVWLILSYWEMCTVHPAPCDIRLFRKKAAHHVKRQSNKYQTENIKNACKILCTRPLYAAATFFPLHSISGTCMFNLGCCCRLMFATRNWQPHVPTETLFWSKCAMPSAPFREQLRPPARQPFIRTRAPASWRQHWTTSTWEDEFFSFDFCVKFCS